MKTIKFKSIKQLADFVTEENVEAIKTDFSLWLDIIVMSRPLEKIGVGKVNTDEFGWIDDGKHDPKFKVKVVNKV